MLEKIHWLGHAAFKITNGKTIYIDPYQVKNGAKADMILVTHDHYDHLSPEDIAKIAKPDTVFIASKGAVSKLSGDVRVMSAGDKIKVDEIEIEAVPSYNVSKPFHPKFSGNLGFILTVEGIRIYHTGDTDLIPEMKDMKTDIALLPCGGTYTMDAKAAAQAARTIKPKIAIPMHWGAIIGSKSDAEEFKKLCGEEIEVKILDKT